MEEAKKHIREIYKKAIESLELPGPAPKLVFYKGAPKMWGKIRKRSTQGLWWFVDIRINITLFNWHFNTETLDTFLKQATQTICHELAHMTHWNHKNEHTNLTNKYIEIVNGAETIRTAAQQVSTIKLSDICTNPTKARAKLRKAGIQKPSTSWEWIVVPQEVKNILGL